MDFKTPEYDEFDNVEDYVGALRGTINSLIERFQRENKKVVDELKKNEKLENEIHRLESYIAKETTSTKVHKAMVECAFNDARRKSAILGGGLIWKDYEEWEESNTFLKNGGNLLGQPNV